ncbi:hypothetical protein DSM104299_02286 [Baekduia alba]|uniref:hypothetical protein n=1 Tax=Baekduia alba TaxID=2997333 RepID=UPI002341D05C|nr:hypothetical protein [Baekduia alba]WCB93573.1 hypothetical protein DSM104299_02286 [Baekduia alba]
MATLGITLLGLGGPMVLTGVIRESSSPTAVAVIVLGSLMLVLGASARTVPMTFTEIKFGWATAKIDTRDADFTHFYREHRSALLHFAVLISGGAQEGQALLREAAARTRLNWSHGASEEPVVATARTILHWVESPGVWSLLVVPEQRRRRWERGPAEEPLPSAFERPGAVAAFARLPFPCRAAFLLDGMLGLGDHDVATLLGLADDAEAHRLMAASGQEVRAALAGPSEAPAC